ncbi:hypothetical protein SEPCBS119000_006523 [Sporothrix epigloea]|uniref:Serine hydrolase domain-containing protein n=1 Tax=Sporothrix epigloea TaxID=1892477 RepID=A0ABP0E6S6_9PEZI
MRVLCLHGKGTSGGIFRSQTAALRAKLDRSFEFDFVDGPLATSPAPGVDKLFDAGSETFAWWMTDSPQAIRSAHAWLDDYLAANGPYDVLMGFSQGCLLISSFLMQRARDLGASLPEHRPPLPFRGAIFVCGGLSLAALTSLNVDVPEKAMTIEKDSVKALHAKTRMFQELASQLSQIQRGVGLWDDTSMLVHDPEAPLPPAEDVFGMDYSPAGGFPEDLYITIPTVHIYGSRDPRYPAALQLAYTCRQRSMYDHGGGHDIPRTTEVSERIADMIMQLERTIRLESGKDVS